MGNKVTVMDDHFSANCNNLKKISAVIQVIFLSSFRLENKCDLISSAVIVDDFSLSDGFMKV